MMPITKNTLKLIKIIYIQVVNFIFSKGALFSESELFAFCNPFARNWETVFQGNGFLTDKNRIA
jgi:hypothetical protein